MTKKKARSMAGLPWIAAMAFFMQALDATILNTALPAIAQSLNRSPLAMQSAIISYTLTVAMLIPVSGWLADRFGTRRVFMLAVTLFTLGSLACALSTSLTELVIFRVLQGIGGAMMMPVARLALLRAYPRSELLPVLNFVTMPGLVGPILGPVLGGVFVTWASWHWIFLINIPIGVAGLFWCCSPAGWSCLVRKSLKRGWHWPSSSAVFCFSFFIYVMRVATRHRLSLYRCLTPGPSPSGLQET